MCTATWLHFRVGYELFFNRDEANSRRPGTPPTIATIHGVRYIAPSDPEAGGTWIGVNEHGLSLALLNRYPITDEETISDLRGPAPDKTSRGLLIRRMIDLKSPEELGRYLREADLDQFRPFTLLAIAPGGVVRRWTWTREGTDPVADSPAPPVASSAYRTRQVLKTRRRTYEEMRRRHGGIDSSVLAEYHASHIPEAGAYSVCMHRDDGKTQSMSRIVVSETDVRFHHTAGSPCMKTGNRDGADGGSRETAGGSRETPAGSGSTLQLNRVRSP